MLRTDERSRYTNYIAMPQRWPQSEFFAGDIGLFVSRGDFDFRQVAGVASLHFIRKGQGIFAMGGQDYPVGVGDLFCLWPGVECHYYDTMETPWEYHWMNFGGTKATALLEAAGFSAATPKGRDPGRRAGIRVEYWHGELARTGSDRAAVAAAWDVLYCLEETSRAAPEPLARRIRRQIDHALYEAPTVQELAESFGISRSHLYRVFAAEYGCSIQEYLAERRLRRTCEMLARSDATLDEIASYCGWSNRQYFIRSFRRATGMTPKRWRQSKAK